MFNVRAGTDYTNSYYDAAQTASIRSLDGDAEFAVGVRMSWKVFEAACVYAKQYNGDLVRVLLPGDIEQPIAFDAHGAESRRRET
jgi:hypothetical protein